MQVFFEENKVKRTIKIKGPEGKIGTVNIDLKSLSLSVAANIAIAYDIAISETDEGGDEKPLGQVYNDRKSWLKGNIQENVLNWDLKKGEDIYPTDDDSLDKLLEVNYFYWSLHDMYLDYVTKIANGKSKSERERELKNYMTLGKPLQKTRRKKAVLKP